MLRRRGIEVVAFGPSVGDVDSYYLIRAYASLEDRERSEAAFYGSDEWRLGPRHAILACIKDFSSIVIQMERAAVESLRQFDPEGRIYSDQPRDQRVSFEAGWAGQEELRRPRDPRGFGILHPAGNC
jgi:hypothetical protein